MEDMCQLTGRLTEDKYKGSMERVANTILKNSSNPGLDVVRFFDITLFLFLTGNGDMHLKNFSLFYNEEGITTLAPAYDMLSSRLLISEQDDPEELALTLNGKKYRFKLTDYLSFAATIGLNEKQIQNTRRRFRKNFPVVLSFIHESPLSNDKNEEFKKLIKNRAERLDLAIPDNH